MLDLANKTMLNLNDATAGKSGKCSDKNQNPSLSCKLAPNMWKSMDILLCILTMQFINMSAVLDHIFFGQALGLNINAQEDWLKLFLLGFCLGIDLLVCNLMYDVKHVIASISCDNHLAQLSIVYFTLNAMLGELASKLKPREQETAEGSSQVQQSATNLSNAVIIEATKVEEEAKEFLSQAVVWMFVVFTMIKTFRRIVKILMNVSNKASDFAWVNMNVLSACSNDIVTVSSIVLRIVQLLAIRCDEMLVVGIIAVALCTCLNYHHIVYVPGHMFQSDPEKQVNMAWKRRVSQEDTVINWIKQFWDWFFARVKRECVLFVQALTSAAILAVCIFLLTSSYNHWEDFAKKLYWLVLVILQMIGPFILMSYFMFHEEPAFVFLRTVVSASGMYCTQLFEVLPWMSVPLQNYMKRMNRLMRSVDGKKRGNEADPGAKAHDLNRHEAVLIAKSMGNMAMFKNACQSTETILVQCRNNGTPSTQHRVYALAASSSETLKTKIRGLEPAQIWFCVTLSLNFRGLNSGLKTAVELKNILTNNVKDSLDTQQITPEVAAELTEHADAMLTNGVLRNGKDNSLNVEPLVDLSSIESLTTARLDELWALLQSNDEDTVESLMSLWAPYDIGTRMLHKDFCEEFESFLLGTDEDEEDV
jgi:hypothetical protein